MEAVDEKTQVRRTLSQRSCKMKVKVDSDLCVATGSCESICPEVFEIGDSGIAVAKVEEVPAGLEDSCREAAESCPVDAITLEE